MAASARFELAKCHSQSVVPYRLATRQFKWWRDMDSNHGTRRNRFTVCRVWPLRYLPKMVARSGFEPETLWLKVKCSTYWASEPKKFKMAASGGFEPPECQSQSLMPYHLATRQKNGAERGTRTPNPLITSQLRYQLRYFGKNGGRLGTRTPDPLLVRQML